MHARPTPRRHPARRAGFTLVELLVSVTLLAMLAATTAGLTAAASRAREHADRLGGGVAGSHAAFERVRRAVSRAGVYRSGDGRVVPGIRAAGPDVLGGPQDTTLVVWTGDDAEADDPDFAATVWEDRLPLVRELTVFAPDPADPSVFREFRFPTDDRPVDFLSPTFRADVDRLLRNLTPRWHRLCDGVRTVRTGGGPLAAVDFTVESTPTPRELADYDAGLLAAAELRWVGGGHGSGWGLRGLRVRTELQIAGGRGDAPAGVDAEQAVPYFASAERIYRHPLE